MVKIFKVVSWLEGISYILLMFFGVPMKYLGGDASYVKMLGMPHGVFFVLYIILAIMLTREFKWSVKTFLWVCVLSLLPFGTFFIGKYLKEEENELGDWLKGDK